MKETGMDTCPPTIRGASKVLMMMRLTLFLTLMLCLESVASVYSQATKMSIDKKDASLKEIIQEIKLQSEFRFLYNDEEVSKAVNLEVVKTDATVEEILDEALENVDLAYQVVNQVILITPTTGKVKKEITPTQAEQPQKKQVKGQVTETNGTPMLGVSVYVKGTTVGTSSDINGEFTLEVPEETQTLMFSFIGYDTKEEKIGPNSTIHIQLTSSQSSLDEVIVVGYGTTKARDFTGSVSRISQDEISTKNVVSPTSILQGLAAGVLVSGNTGRPGEYARVRVRGATSLTGNNDPLYVINGVPTDNSDLINSIPPSDIASIDVLKDASATAIYGSRAANGVVMVTTKGGNLNQKAKFSFNYHLSNDNQINNFSVLDGNEFRSFLKDLAVKTLAVDPANRTAKNINDPNGDYLGTANTNWFEEVKQTAARHNFDMSVSGGSDNITYFMSGSVLNQKGMVIGDDMTRYGAHLNLDAFITKKFKIGSKVSLSYTDRNSSGTSLFNAQGERPDLPIYKEDQVTFYDLNPVAYTKKINNSDSYRFTGTLYGQVEIMDGLKLKSSLSANQSMGFVYTFSPSFLDYYKKATASRSENRSFSTVFDNTISYVKNIKDVHFIDIVGGVSFENTEYQSGYLSKQGFPMDEIYINVSGGTDFSQSSDDKAGSGLFSSFARFNYKYDDKYLATVTARYDGSSMFGKNNRFGFFPSVGLAWRIDAEDFMQSFDFIDELKLKASAGKTGIQNLANYSNRDLYAATSYNGIPGIIHSQIGNNDIQWELSTLYDAGLDFALFNNRISGSVGYYLKDTKDLIWSLSFPSTMAVNSMKYNVGSVRNQGVEFSAKANLINREDFKIDLGLNLAHNKNEITKLVEKGATVNSSGAIVQGTSSQVLAVGHSMGSFFGYEYNGIIQNEERIKELNDAAIAKGNSTYDGKLFPGNLEITDLNDDGKIDSKDQTILGSPDPDVFGGMSLSVEYKNFSLATNFSFQLGGKKIYGKSLQNVPAQLTGLVDYNLYNRWAPDNTDAKIPAIYLEQGVSKNTRLNLHNTSFFRLQDMVFAYNLPVIKSCPVQGKVYISATNLFTITKYPGTDPATVNSYNNYGGNYETSYPGIRTFSLGIKVTL